jgi:pimeloyl-ACP methyl ester carboxylesterase
MDHPRWDRRSLLAALAAGAAAWPPRLALAQPPGAPPAPWTSEGYVDRPGGRLHYVSIGDGQPLILLHKLGGWVADWRYLAPLLARERRVIAFDMPGHGQSSMHEPPPYVFTLGESVAMIKAALEDLGIDRFDLVGSSLGGCVGVLMAAFYPQSVRRLALISVALNGASSRDDLIKTDAAQSAQYGPDGEPLPRTAQQTQTFASIDPRVNEEDNLSRAKAGLWIRPSQRGVAVTSVDSYLSRIEAPTLLVYADRGTYTRFEAVGRARLKHPTVAVIRDTGSFTYQEKPAETASVLAPFLAA